MPATSGSGKILQVDQMLQRAQDKVDAIKRVQSMTAGARPIDEVVFGQNVPTYNQNGSTLTKEKPRAI